MISDQERLLLKLLKKASNTDFGQLHEFNKIHSYGQFNAQVPLQSYPLLEPFIERVKSGEQDVLWPGKVHHIAVSSGTTGKGKHIPITPERLKSDQKYQRNIFSSLIKYPPLWSTFKGKVLSMPGGTERIQTENSYYLIGEITGITASQVSPIIEHLQVEKVQKLTSMAWDEKFESVLQKAIKTDVRVIIGAPTWIVELLRQAIQKSKKSISTLWPNLGLIISGGVAYSHYQKQIDEIIEYKPISVLEMYGASEGYLGLSRVNDIGWFDLQLNQGMVYEFEEVETGELNLLSGVKENVDYSVRMSSNTGLWRYPLKDIVRFRDNLQCEIVGRLGSVSDYFGEYVSKEEVLSACKDIGFNPIRVVIAPFEEVNTKRLVLFIDEETFKKLKYKTNFEEQLDSKLSEINRHYAIRRETNAMHKLRVSPWNAYVEQVYLNLCKGKAQQKIPDVILNVETTRSLIKSGNISSSLLT